LGGVAAFSVHRPSAAAGTGQALARPHYQDFLLIAEAHDLQAGGHSCLPLIASTNIREGIRPNRSEIRLIDPRFMRVIDEREVIERESPVL
jgi:hypothetical protein